MTAMRLALEGVRKTFGRLEVLGGVHIAIAPGRTTAIVGPNAAGKSTLIKSILGLVRPDAGRLTMNGQPIGADPSYRADIGYMPQAARFPEQLTGREVLDLLCGLRSRTAGLDYELVERLHLEPHLGKPVHTLSGGTRQKLNAAVAFLFRPSLIMLDEPTAGLDPVASRILKDKVRRAAAHGATVLLTSHIMSEIEELADDLVFLVEGRVIYQGPVASLLEATGEPRLERAIAGILEQAA